MALQYSHYVCKKKKEKDAKIVSALHKYRKVELARAVAFQSLEKNGASDSKWEI